MRPVAELEVQPIMLFLNLNALGCCIMLDDQLFKEQKGPLVIHSLPDLNLSNPSMRSVSLLAIITLLVLDNILDYKGLL